VTPPGKGWNEANLSEDPAVEVLEALGFTYVGPEVLEAERDTLKETVLSGRLEKALKKLNPWLSADNAKKVARSLMGLQAASLIEASEKVYTLLTYGMAIEQDGQPSLNVRFFDFESPTKNELDRHPAVHGQGRQEAHSGRMLASSSTASRSPWSSARVPPWARAGSKRRSISSPGTRSLTTSTGSWEPRGSSRPSRCSSPRAARRRSTAPSRRPTVSTRSGRPRGLSDDDRLRGPSWTGAHGIQDVTLAGLLRSANLLDLVRNFVVFERDAATGRTIRKLCRYQQFTAVNKAIERAAKAKKAEDRGGVVWHTQGSGKSLTMLWLALKLRRDPTPREPDPRHRHRPEGPGRADHQDVPRLRVPEPGAGRERP
jgi:type I restriction enzyme R subunit